MPTNSEIEDRIADQEQEDYTYEVPEEIDDAEFQAWLEEESK